MYFSRPGLFIGIGLVTIPVSILVTLLQTGIISASTFLGITSGSEGGGVRAWFVLAIGTVLSLLGLTFVQAAAARAMAEIDAGRDVSFVGAYRLALDSIRPLFLALLVAVPIVSLLTVSVFLIPIAIALAVRWALIAPCAAAARWCGGSGSRCCRWSSRRAVSSSSPGRCSAASSCSPPAPRSRWSTSSPV
jgi:hypothetical protein